MSDNNTIQKKEIFYFDTDPGYDTIKDVCKGDFTTLTMSDGRTIFLNETGKYHLPVNRRATEMFGIVIYGDIAIVGIPNN